MVSRDEPTQASYNETHLSRGVLEMLAAFCRSDRAIAGSPIVNPLKSRGATGLIVAHRSSHGKAGAGWLCVAVLLCHLIAGTCWAATAARVRARPFPTETRLVRNGRADVLIVYGDAHREAAARLQAQLRDLCGVEPPMMLDTDATAGRLWTLRDEVGCRNLIVLGDINTNRGVLALYAKFLAAATGRFPGPGRYVVRHLAEPFVPSKTAVVIGASDAAGLELGIARLVELFKTSPRERYALGFPLLEFGDARGPDQFPESGATFRDYRDAAYVFYSGGRATQRYAWFSRRSPVAARKAARELVLAAIAENASHFPVGGHYTFIPNYQALRIIICHGLLSASELRDLEERLLDNALASKDGYVKYFRNRRKRFMASVRGNPSRHSSSAIVGQYLLLDYLANFADVTGAAHHEVDADYALFSKLIRDWHDARIFRARVGDLESLDCTAFFIYGFMHLGLEEFVGNGVIENMADFYLNNVNNLWCDAGASHYIGAYRGCHIRSPRGGLAVRALAFFTRNRSLEFLDTQRFEKAGTYQRGFSDKGGMCLGQPEPFALPRASDEAALPCPMLRKTPLDPFMWRTIKANAQKEGTPVSLAYEQVYDTIGFRDGWTADDAFLGLKGLHAGRLWQVNTIFGYTDCGARVLFGGSQTHENWYRCSITVDTAGYASQDSFAQLEAAVSNGDVALVASSCARFNGACWQRTILRRRRAYFAVLDDITALGDDAFRLTATWRVLPPGRIADHGAFEAVAQNGVRCSIAPGAPVAAEVTRPVVDGVARPTFYRQQRDVRLAEGQTVSFHNVLTAARPDQHVALRARTVGVGNLLRVHEREDGSETALIGTRSLPGGAAMPAGTCTAFYLSQKLWVLGGLQALSVDQDELLRSSQPVDVVLDWAKRRATVSVHGSDAVSVALVPRLGGTGESIALSPGSHTFALQGDAPTGFQAAVARLPLTAPAQAHARPAEASTATKPFAEIWRRQVQARPASLIRPLRVRAAQPPDTMALHNLCDGVLWNSSLPAPVWQQPELVLSVKPPAGTQAVTGLRVIGNVGRIVVEEQTASGAEHRPVAATETAHTLFAGYSSHRVGGRLYRDRLLRFRGTGRELRLRLAAADPKHPTVHVGEIQLLGAPQPHGVWGRLRVERLAPDAAPLLFCRTGTYVDTVEQGGHLRTFALDGTALWQHAETAPAQYRDKYWCTADMDADGTKELVTYADDMVLRVFRADGQGGGTVDLHAWEGKRQGTPMGGTAYGGKSIAAWPVRADGRPDLFVFGHVHHHQIRLTPSTEVTRRDRVPTWDCAPAASVAVHGWSRAGKQNLVGVAPYQAGVILWEDGGPGQPPKLVVKRAFGKPLVQPSANNQQPVFVECLRVRRPDGILAVTPRGAQFFAKPDLEPGWVAVGMCPTSAATATQRPGGEPDRVFIGRENGRVLQLDAATGELRAQALLDGVVRRIIPTKSGRVLVGTTHGLFVLDRELRVRGRQPFPLEDVAMWETAEETSVFALLTNGQLVGLRAAGEER